MSKPAETAPLTIVTSPLTAPQQDSGWHAAGRYFFRLAASGLVPPRWFAQVPPAEASRRQATGRLSIEVVSHCWKYAHLLVYQLSSLVLHPPRNIDVRMTVFYAAEDEATARLLAFFSEHKVPGVRWNWQVLPREQLMRRSIGRNIAALASQADWVWFTDCDLIFGEGCLDRLAQRLQGRTDALVYPQEEQCTALLPDSDDCLRYDAANPSIVAANGVFKPKNVTRATGPLQITHGDVARATGYCNAIKVCQMPAEHWCKAHEDRIFRWLLGTQGVPLDIPGVQRIRHVSKGRYNGSNSSTQWRKWVRRSKEAALSR